MQDQFPRRIKDLVHAVYPLVFPDHVAAGAFLETWLYTRDYLRRNWDVVEAIADGLLEHGELDSEQASTIAAEAIQKRVIETEAAPAA